MAIHLEGAVPNGTAQVACDLLDRPTCLNEVLTPYPIDGPHNSTPTARFMPRQAVERREKLSPHETQAFGLFPPAI
jgi:hypothetical protein